MPPLRGLDDRKARTVIGKCMAAALGTWVLQLKAVELRQSGVSVAEQPHDRRGQLQICGDRAIICVICVLLQDFDAALSRLLLYCIPPGAPL
jgi:hypothetical protein